MGAPAIATDWNELRTLAIALGSADQAADQFGVSRVAARKRASREHWFMKHKQVQALAQTIKSEKAADQGLSQVVTTAAEALAQMGNDTRAKLGSAANKAAGRISQMDADEIIECSPKLKDITSVASTVHGWDKQGSSGQTIVNIAFLSDTAYASPCDSLPSVEPFDALD